MGDSGMSNHGLRHQNFREGDYVGMKPCLQGLHSVPMFLGSCAPNDEKTWLVMALIPTDFAC